MEKIHINGTIHKNYFELSDDNIIIDIALDWITQNLYVYTDKAVGIVKFSENPKKFRKIFSHNGTEEGKILVHPNRGYLFLFYYRK